MNLFDSKILPSKVRYIFAGKSHEGLFERVQINIFWGKYALPYIGKCRYFTIVKFKKRGKKFMGKLK